MTARLLPLCDRPGATTRKFDACLPGGTAEVVDWRRNPHSVPPELSTLSVEQRVAGERPKQLIVLDPAVPYQSDLSAPDAVERARKAKPNAQAVYVFRDDDEFPGSILVGVSESSNKLADSKPVFIDAEECLLLVLAAQVHSAGVPHENVGELHASHSAGEGDSN